MICRIGGDEFAILVHHLDDTSKLRIISQRILNALSKPFYIDGNEIFASTSIGIASFPDCASDKVQLMKCADVAMYRAKEKGRNQAQFYSKDVHDEILKRFELEQDLLSALENNEFVVFYQPLLDCVTEKIVGAESLVRWLHPKKGLLLPGDFIPIAEEIGVIKNLGEWILETACAQYSNWHKKYAGLDPEFSITVNLSALQLNEKSFAEYTKSTLAKYKIQPECLELEVTESVLIESSEIAGEVLRDLAGLGIKLSLDDFGTGYSSLSQLQKYPFQVLKIDKSFVQSIEEKEDDTAVFLKSINALAKALCIETVVEGVETKIQKWLCQELDFNRMQGFYFAKAMNIDDFDIFLQPNSSSMKSEMSQT